MAEMEPLRTFSETSSERSSNGPYLFLLIQISSPVHTLVAVVVVSGGGSGSVITNTTNPPHAKRPSHVLWRALGLTDDK